MIQKALLVALVLIAAQAIHLNQAHEADPVLKAGKITLQADNGDFLRTCRDCGGSVLDPASIQGYINNHIQRWIVNPVRDKVTLKSSMGNYLTICSKCWRKSSISDSAFAYLLTPVPASWWTPELLSNGKYAFKGTNGKYLARCESCTNQSSKPNYAFVDVTSSSVPQAQWTVKYL